MAADLVLIDRDGPGGGPFDEVAQAPAAATAEVKRRILRHRNGRSLRELTKDEEQALEAALLGAHVN